MMSEVCSGRLFCIKINKMQEKIEHSLAYKIVKDFGSYIVWEAKLSPYWRFMLGLPFILLGTLFLSPIYFIYKKGYLPSLTVLFVLSLGILFILAGLAIVGSWKSLVLDGALGTLTLYKYFLWRPFTRTCYFSGIEGVEVMKTTREFVEESLPQEYYEIRLLYEGTKISLDGSTNKEEAGEFAKKIAQMVGREVKWN